MRLVFQGAGVAHHSVQSGTLFSWDCLRIEFIRLSGSSQIAKVFHMTHYCLERKVFMQTVKKKLEGEISTLKQAVEKATDIAAASVPDTLTMLHVDSDAGLAGAEVDARRKEYGYNEVAEHKDHPALKFLGKFWGMSAGMLE
jgi:magnesium-transporting ATPase (P-type)